MKSFSGSIISELDFQTVYKSPGGQLFRIKGIFYIINDLFCRSEIIFCCNIKGENITFVLLDGNITDPGCGIIFHTQILGGRDIAVNVKGFDPVGMLCIIQPGHNKVRGGTALLQNAVNIHVEVTDLDIVGTFPGKGKSPLSVKAALFLKLHIFVEVQRNCNVFDFGPRCIGNSKGTHLAPGNITAGVLNGSLPEKFLSGLSGIEGERFAADDFSLCKSFFVSGKTYKILQLSGNSHIISCRGVDGKEITVFTLRNGNIREAGSFIIQINHLENQR